MRTKQELILTILQREQWWMYGLELVGLSEGALKRGTIYVYLIRLEDEGLIESKLEDKPVMPRRLYKITPAGIRYMSKREAELMA